MRSGFLIAAPHSGSGKTTLTLGLLRALTRAGVNVRSAKAGPDFIDPAFHAAATGQDCFNLDPWAMRPDYLLSLAKCGEEPLIVEAMMGLFDGGADGKGSAADLARMLGLPVVLVVDASKQSHSIAALVHGFRSFRTDVQIVGVILNKVGSTRHETMLREALNAIEMPVLGCVFRDETLTLPSRHLGLVQADEHGSLDDFLNDAAGLVDTAVNLNQLLALDGLDATVPVAASSDGSPLVPLGQKIAVAKDQAFAFCYPHILKGWRAFGAEISFFSPMNDEAPQADCDAVYLPGGYPELHAGVLAQSNHFIEGVQKAAERSALIYGECGGFMVLGTGLIDAEGYRHEMANLLPLVTSFEKRKLNLGYRLANPLSDLPFANGQTLLTAHEFHYSTIAEEGDAEPLFAVEDARGQDLGSCGMRRRNVAGSYLHIIDRR